MTKKYKKKTKKYCKTLPAIRQYTPFQKAWIHQTGYDFLDFHRAHPDIFCWIMTFEFCDLNAVLQLRATNRYYTQLCNHYIATLADLMPLEHTVTPMHPVMSQLDKRFAKIHRDINMICRSLNSRHYDPIIYLTAKLPTRMQDLPTTTLFPPLGLINQQPHLLPVAGALYAGSLIAIIVFCLCTTSLNGFWAWATGFMRAGSILSFLSSLDFLSTRLWVHDIVTVSTEKRIEALRNLPLAVGMITSIRNLYCWYRWIAPKLSRYGPGDIQDFPYYYEKLRPLFQLLPRLNILIACDEQQYEQDAKIYLEHQENERIQARSLKHGRVRFTDIAVNTHPNPDNPITAYFKKIWQTRSQLYQSSEGHWPKAKIV